MGLEANLENIPCLTHREDPEIELTRRCEVNRLARREEDSPSYRRDDRLLDLTRRKRSVEIMLKNPSPQTESPPIRHAAHLVVENPRSYPTD